MTALGGRGDRGGDRRRRLRGRPVIGGKGVTYLYLRDSIMERMESQREKEEQDIEAVVEKKKKGGAEV
jgi:hypothetical protein